MKTQELKNKSNAELQDEIMSLRRELFNLRMQQKNPQSGAAAQANNVARIRMSRRDIARIKTILNERAREKKS
jgi:large subunit ribosomal protein L29